MRRPGGSFLAALGACALGLLSGAPLHAAGFGIFEQGTKAMGMAGAFTAQADDPSLLFHNAGGLAFVEETAWSGGLTYFQGTEAEFEGAGPFPGPGAQGEQELLSQPLPHAYGVMPINQTWKFGLGVNAPFGLTTEWQDSDQFAGRFLSTKAALRAIDVNPTIGWQVTPSFGIGFGAVARISDLELRRNVPTINPATQRVIDAARLQLEGDFSEGYGWNAGILHRFNESFSWGLSYRSKVEIDYEGDARLTQVPTGNAQLDAVIRSRLPFDTDLPVATTIEFPDMASLGFAFALTRNVLLETDANWTGWSSFQEVPIEFTGTGANQLPDSVIPEEWEDVYNYRAGLRWRPGGNTRSEWRFGYVFDETPQPEESVSPLLPDADRNGFTVGYGHTGNHTWDFALMYIDFDERTRARSFENEGPFFGTYNTQAVLLGLTFTW